ncbi:MAG: hypothetical protein OHK0013_40950 [Sandaracinaceae bacterium]
MQLIDQIEKRRFVGRELLLWLWMESELFEGTLAASPHGSFEGGEFGLWIEKKLVLSAGEESTRITAAAPGLGREAKEALLRGQLPEGAGIRIAWKDDETSLAMDAESFALRGLKLRTLLDKGGEESFAGDLVDEMAGRRRPGKPKRQKTEDEEDAGEEAAFHERMMMTRELEDLLAALYRDFLALRLGPRWDAVIVPTMRRWAAGEEIDAYAYKQSKRGKKGEAPPSGKQGNGRARR